MKAWIKLKGSDTLYEKTVQDGTVRLYDKASNNAILITPISTTEPVTMECVIEQLWSDAAWEYLNETLKSSTNTTVVWESDNRKNSSYTIYRDSPVETFAPKSTKTAAKTLVVHTRAAHFDEEAERQELVASLRAEVERERLELSGESSGKSAKVLSAEVQAQVELELQAIEDIPARRTNGSYYVVSGGVRQQIVFE